jgi:hypothetical protein
MSNDLMTIATIRFPHERDCYVFGNRMFRKNDKTFPTQKQVIRILRNVSDLNVPQVMELIESMETNTNYWFKVFTGSDKVNTLENLGFIVTVE